MKRFTILVACAFIWLIPASSAMAATWSWHSDLVERLVEIIEDIKDNQAEEGQGREHQLAQPLVSTPHGAIVEHSRLKSVRP